MEFNKSKALGAKASFQKQCFYMAAKYESDAEIESLSQKRRATISSQLEAGTTVGPVKFKKLEDDFFLVTSLGNYDLDTGELSAKSPSNQVEIVREFEDNLHKEKNATILSVKNGKITLKVSKWDPNDAGTWEELGNYFLRTKNLALTHKFRKRLEEMELPPWPPTIEELSEVNKNPLQGEEPFLKDKDQAFQICFRLICNGNTLAAINGPPGTGKTTLLAFAASYLAKHGKTLFIASSTNTAVETALEKIAQTWKELGLDINPNKIAKKVSQNETLPSHLSELGIRQISNQDLGNPKIFENYAIVGCTMVSLASNPPKAKADFVYFDEAGQIPAFQVAACAGLGHNEVLLGDACQLAPVLSADHTDIMDSAKSAMGLVQKRFPQRLQTLLVNHRSNSKTVEHTRKAHYPNVDLKATTNKDAHIEGKEPLIEINGKVLKLPLQGTHFINVDHKNRKKHCPEEAEVAMEIIQSLLGKTKVVEDGKKSPITFGDIAVLAPYRHQSQQIMLKIEELGKDAKNLLCGTVHKLQGKGRTVVIYSLSASNKHFLENTAEFLFDPHLINVATSRSVAVCYILGNKEILNRIQPTTLIGLELLEKTRVKLEELEVS